MLTEKTFKPCDLVCLQPETSNYDSFPVRKGNVFSAVTDRGKLNIFHFFFEPIFWNCSGLEIFKIIRCRWFRTRKQPIQGSEPRRIVMSGRLPTQSQGPLSLQNFQTDSLRCPERPKRKHLPRIKKVPMVEFS